jgi:hypothetical protein
MEPWIKCRFLVSRPLDGERVDLLGADVAGEDQRIVRGDAHWRRRPAQVLQADDGFRLAIGDADAHRRRGRTSGYNEHRFQIPGRDPADQGGGKQFSLFPRPEIEKRKLPRGLHGHQFVLTEEYARAKPDEDGTTVMFPLLRSRIRSSMTPAESSAGSLWSSDDHTMRYRLPLNNN